VLVQGRPIAMVATMSAFMRAILPRSVESTMKIGVDLGGTKIEIAALDETGAIRLRQRVATPPGDYAATIEAVGEPGRGG
jgi:hypothetical protein